MATVKGHAFAAAGRYLIGRYPGSGQAMYGTQGVCECGWSCSVNDPPSKGGSVGVRRKHRAHVADVTPTKPLSEGDFKRWVKAKAKAAGWLVFSFEPAMVKGQWVTNVPRGFPDLVLVRPPVVAFLELKRNQRSVVRPEQVVLMRALQGCTEVEAFVVSPADALDVLRLLARPVTGTGSQLSSCEPTNPEGEPRA